MLKFANSAELAATSGQRHGPSDWLKIDQAVIDGFADVTGDRQWIHVDTDRAIREMPGGKTIAHGYLTLALLGTLMPQIYEVEAKQILNVGLEKLRFLSPVQEGSRIRLFLTVKDAQESPHGRRMTVFAEFEVEGSERPAMVAELLFLYVD